MFFEMFDFADNVEGSAVQVAGRIGARVALRVNGEVIEKMTVRPFEVPALRVGTEVPYRFTVTNGGNLNKSIVAWVTLLDRNENQVTASQVASETAVLARSNLAFSDTLDTVAGRFGPHTMEVRIQYIEEDSELPSEIVEQRTIWLIPVWLLSVAAVAVFGLTVWLAMRVSRGPRSRQVDEPGHRAKGGTRAQADERRRLREERMAQAQEQPSAEAVVAGSEPGD